VEPIHSTCEVAIPMNNAMDKESLL
jgi:hypothetical protein